MEVEDFFAKDLTRTIEIELTFRDFNATEAELFASRIHYGEMTVTRVFEAGGGRANGSYYGSTLKHPAFDQIRAAEGARDKTAAYNALRSSGGKYSDLPQAKRVDQIAPALEAWELEHADHCVLGRDDGRFFGFTNVAKGALQKATNFVFVPAVRDASADAVDAKGAVIAKLMELVVRSAIQKRRDIQEFQKRIAEEFHDITNPAQLPELGGLADALSETLRIFYNDAGVELTWRAVEDFTVPLPSADVSLDDDGFKGPVDRKGHGLQRAFVLTLLQHLARATSDAAALAESETAEAAQTEGIGESSQHCLKSQRELPGLILAIEEPELYQHPTKQRHFARVLNELSAGRIPGVATTTQVIFASHSSLFVSLDRFDQIRIARRSPSTSVDVKGCVMHAANLAKVARKLEQASEAAVGSFSEEGLMARLHILGPELAEGFFANLVVLVEGVSDRAALLATAELMGADFEALGIAVLPVGGKNNLDRPAAIFREFGIPVYIIWDCDWKESDKDREVVLKNHMLQRLCEVNAGIFDFDTSVSRYFACFYDKLETTLRDEIGGSHFLGYLDAAKKQYGIAKDRDALKTPVVVRQVLRLADVEGRFSFTMQAIVEAIVALHSNQFEKEAVCA